jgi:hypothetical protein
LHLLGGFGQQAGGENAKTFTEFPVHKSVRIVANFHFIDAWAGESGFMRANIGYQGKMEYLWNESYDYSKAVGGFNVCGADYIEAKFSSKIDLTIPHDSDKITIGFGSTLDQDPFENSFGISNLQIFII